MRRMARVVKVEKAEGTKAVRMKVVAETIWEAEKMKVAEKIHSPDD